MREFRRGPFVLFVSDDIAEEKDRLVKTRGVPEVTLIDALLADLDAFFPDIVDSTYRQYIDLFGRNLGKREIGVLYAHGDSRPGVGWTYRDGDERRPVQEWLDAQDGKFSCLACLTCNPGSHTTQTKTSLLFIPDRDVATLEEYSATLIHPKKGEIDGYVIDAELAELQKRSRA